MRLPTLPAEAVSCVQPNHGWDQAHLTAKEAATFWKSHMQPVADRQACIHYIHRPGLPLRSACGLLLDQQLHSLTSSTAAIPLAARFRINSSSTAERQRCMLLSCHRYGLRLGSPAAAPCGSSECIEKDPFKWQVGQAAVLVLKCMKCMRHAAACRGCVSSNSCHTAPAQPLARPACPLWFPSLLHKGSTLLSSCCSNCGRWDDFFKACKGCRVDFMGGLAANAAGG